ncbi:hypothetical protein PG910_08785 [Tenacibaculum dicentrarchi]|nr:hypothetical protein PG910_08785 [Tenacibaculum dicentrarchi]
MKNQYPKIANIQLQISENCSDLEKEILHFHWEMEELKFTNTPKKTKETYDITQGYLTKLNANHSKLSVYILCKNCTSYEVQISKSHSKFKEVLKLKQGHFKCNHCTEQERNLAEEQRKKENDKLIESLKIAIENENWNNLSKFEKTLLVHCLEKSFNQVKSHYGKLLGQGNFYQLIRALENIEAQNLIVLIRNSWNNYVTNFKYLDSLKDHQKEINFIKELSDDNTTFDDATNTLKFKLTINEFQHHPDSPLYAGAIKFKERIIIEPDVDYIFGLWQRSNDNLYLTIIPVSEFEKRPTQKPITKLPKQIKQGVHEFLNTIGSTFNLE